MLAFGLMLALLDPPDWSACEAFPWGTTATDGLGWVRDEVVSDAEDRQIYIRVWGVPMGFGYAQVLLAIWNSAPAGAQATIRAEQGVTACKKTALEPLPEGLRIRTEACGYHDDEPVGHLETRLGWSAEAPFVTVVD